MFVHVDVTNLRRGLHEQVDTLHGQCIRSIVTIQIPCTDSIDAGLQLGVDEGSLLEVFSFIVRALWTITADPSNH